MDINKSILAVALSATALLSHAQNEVDALRYSQIFHGGTARYVGMGGAFGALGADLSVASTNPAGLGRFSQNQATFTLSNINTNSTTSFSGTETNSGRNAVRVDNLGILFSSNKEGKGKGWRSTQFAFTYNRLADFTSNRFYSGENYNSLLEGFAAQGNGIPSDLIYDYNPFTTAMGWYTYAIDDIPEANGDTYYAPRLTQGNMLHDRRIQTRGGISEYSLAFAGNYLNKWYIGGSINFQNTRYFENYSHSEELLDPSAEDRFFPGIDGTSLRSFTYNWEQTSKGTGVNVKLGAIYAPIDEFRIGLAFHTPTVMRFKDTFRAGMNATHENDYYEVPSNVEPVGEFSYRFSNPLRTILSAGYVFMRRLAVNAEVELANYGWGKYRNSSDVLMQVDWTQENQTIRNMYRSTLNLRAGVEFAVTPELFVRGGFAYYPSPYDKSITNQGGDHMFYSAGLGYRWRSIFLDAGYRFHQTKIDYYAFNPGDITNLALINENKHQIMFTVGVRF